ncbi:MAG: hypothetical protein JHD16_17575 [Solirubrobacteraceae bacterium]|nr:hypothetical protein [Solirubrobacteraceae bacterium]
MSPAPRKPAKPTSGPPKASDGKPVKPRAATPKQQAALREALDRAQAGQGPELTVRMTGKPPSRAALKRLGLTDPKVDELAQHLAKHADAIASKLRADRSLAALLASDPSAALQQLDIPEHLRPVGDASEVHDLLDRFRGVKFDVGAADGPAIDDLRPTPAQTAALQLIADSFARAAASPTTFATLKTDPLTVVTAAANAKPPAGMTAGSLASASVVLEVSRQVGAVYGAPQKLTRPATETIHVPRPAKGA